MIVTDQSKIDEMYVRDMEKEVGLVSDRLWFRRAVTLKARPYALVCPGITVYLWETLVGDSEIWGGSQYCDTDRLPVTDADYEVFMRELEQPHSFSSFVSEAHAKFNGVKDDTCMPMLLYIGDYSSIEDFVSRSWSSKRRRSVLSELKRFDGFKRVWSDEPDSSVLDFLFERGREVAEKNGDEARFDNVHRRAALLNLVEVASGIGKYKCLSVYDKDRLVAAELVIEDGDCKSALSVIGHSLAEYPSLGKLLYFLVIEREIQQANKIIDSGSYLCQIKLLFRYKPMTSYKVVIV